MNASLSSCLVGGRCPLHALSPAERRGFPPLAPYFVIEIRPSSDLRGGLEAKMAEYRQTGVSTQTPRRPRSTGRTARS
jgi:hypothetical protein